MTRSRQVAALAFGVLILSPVACAPDAAPTAPALRAAASASTTLAAAPTSAPAVFMSSNKDDPRLKRIEEQEKYRVWQESERQKATYDSLKLVWDGYLKQNYDRGTAPYLMCDPLQYTAQVKIVGPEGADIGFGPHKLTIPRGALSKYVVITAEMPTSTYADTRFSPHGLTFAKQPKLVLDYKHCYQPAGATQAVVYHDDALNVLERPASVDYASYDYITAWLDHFSGYAVAYGRRPR